MKTTLKFNKGNHSYRLDSKPIPGVTTLISKGVAKDWLGRWAAKTVAEYVAHNDIEPLRAMGESTVIQSLKNVPWEKRDAAGVRGTDIHALAEQIIHGESVIVPPHLGPYLEGYVRFLDAFDVQPVWTERACASRKWWYAGTADAVVTMGKGPHAGQTLLVDWKTSKSIYGEHALQVAAYANAEFVVDDEGEEQPLPPLDALGVVHITDGGTELYIVRDPELAWTQFQHAQWMAKQADAIKSQFGDPVGAA